MRRVVALIALAVVLLVAPLPSPVAADSPLQAVTWKVDHKAKTITCVVRLFMYPGKRPPNQPDDPNVRRKFNEWIVQRIYQDIMNVWNAGYTYRCYKLVFEADIVFDDDGDRFTVPDDRVGVRLSYEAVNFRSFVTSKETTRWDSNSPSDRVVPKNSFSNPTTWNTSDFSHNLYAHEFGHVMGLDDGYIEWTDKETGERRLLPRPGAPKDLMSDSSERLDQSTINRLVQRSGVVKDSDLQCGYRVNYNEGPMHITGLKCGGFEGRWELEEHMDFAMTQHFKLVADIGPTMRGTYTFQYDVSNLRQGGRVGPGGTAGASGGEAVFEPGPPPTLTLAGTKTFKFVLETNVPECAGK